MNRPGHTGPAPAAAAPAATPCAHRGPAQRPAFPTHTALLAGLMSLLLSTMITPTLGMAPFLAFCLWRNANHICPGCRNRPHRPNLELRPPWTTESTMLWAALAATAALMAASAAIIVPLLIRLTQTT